MDTEEEQPYERMPRSNHEKLKGNDGEPKRKAIARLPIKLPNGQIQQIGIREGSIETSSEEEEVDQVKGARHPPKSNIAGSRFGRTALADVVRIKSKKERLTAAKEQIAAICQDILAEPENGVRYHDAKHTCTKTSSAWVVTENFGFRRLHCYR